MRKRCCCRCCCSTTPTTTPRATKAPEPVAELFPDGLRYTAAEVAERTGVSLDHAKRLWRALGFPEAGDEAFYTEDDLAALNTLTDIVASGIIDFDLAVNLT